MKKRSACLLAAVMIAAACSPIAHAEPAQKLQRGDEGDAVKEVQQLLKNHDCYDYDEITGYFGNATEDGVRKFQAEEGLDVDGIVGEDTLKKLKESPTKALKPDSLARGVSGDAVKDVQERLQDLGLYTEPKITGFYGPKTESAVKVFQSSVGVEADGIVGKKTLAELMDTHSSTSLVPGMKSGDVSKLQQRLKDLGYFKGSVTGLYGQATEDTVRNYQKLNGLDQDGIAGKVTRSSIMSKNARSYSSAKRSPSKTSSSSSSSSSASSSKSSRSSEDTPDQSAKGQDSGQAIVDYAKQFIGRPYVYGADGPESFDCTGLTSYVYKHFGVSLPRSARDQGYNDYGTKITDKSQLMPGDLVFFKHSDGVIHHAGIYVGGGKFIHAPQTGEKVRIDTLSSHGGFAWGRRIFK